MNYSKEIINLKRKGNDQKFLAFILIIIFILIFEEESFLLFIISFLIIINISLIEIKKQEEKYRNNKNKINDINIIKGEIYIKPEDTYKDIQIINTYENIKRTKNYDNNEDDFKYENEKEILENIKIKINVK